VVYFYAGSPFRAKPHKNRRQKRKTANSGEFVLPILTEFWKGQRTV